MINAFFTQANDGVEEGVLGPKGPAMLDWDSSSQGPVLRQSACIGIENSLVVCHLHLQNVHNNDTTFLRSLW